MGSKKTKELEKNIIPYTKPFNFLDGSFFGFDASYTGFGVASRTINNTTGFCTLKTKPDDFKNDLERIDYLVKTSINLICNPKLLCIEDVFVGMGNQVGSAMKLMGLAYILRKALNDLQYPFIIISPPQLKKYILGKGNGSKDQITKEVYKQWNLDVKDDNQADAVVLAYLAEDIYKYMQDANYLKTIAKSKAEVIKTIAHERPSYNINFNH